MKKQLRRMTAGIAAAAMLLAPVSTEGTFPSGDASPAELTAQAGDFDYLFAPITGTCGAPTRKALSSRTVSMPPRCASRMMTFS